MSEECNKNIDDFQVNIRFNEKDHQKLQHRYRKHIVRTKGKVPSIQCWIRETMLA